MFNFSPLTQRRWQNFKANRRAWYSLVIFAALFVLTLFAEFIANDKPLLVRYDGAFYTPVFTYYSEDTFGGELDAIPDYTDPYLHDLINEKGWAIWPPIPYSYDTIIFELQGNTPSPPTFSNLLGTDSTARDVLARAIYGFRISVLFGLILTILSSLIGIVAGAVQGYYGGWVDLLFQRFIEIWGGMPSFFLLIILVSLVSPNFWWLLGLLLLFSWMTLVGVVRAEFLRARNFDYVRAARSLGVPDRTIMRRHIFPNAMVATVTLMPFILSGGVTALTSLDLIGLGLPPGSPSLGELLAQGRTHLFAPWLGITAFVTTAGMLTLLVFIGEGVRDAFDPRKTFASDGLPRDVAS